MRAGAGAGRGGQGGLSQQGWQSGWRVSGAVLLAALEFSVCRGGLQL